MTENRLADLQERDKWLMILQERKEYFLYKQVPRNFARARTIRSMMKLVTEGKIKDYTILESFGIPVIIQKDSNG